MGIFFDNGIVWNNIIPIAIFLFIIFEVIIMKIIKKKGVPNETKYFTFMLMNVVNIVASIFGALCLSGIIDGLINVVTFNVEILVTIGIILLIIAIKTVLFILFIYEKK